MYDYEPHRSPVFALNFSGYCGNPPNFWESLSGKKWSDRTLNNDRSPLANAVPRCIPTHQHPFRTCPRIRIHKNGPNFGRGDFIKIEKFCQQTQTTFTGYVYRSAVVLLDWKYIANEPLNVVRKFQTTPMGVFYELSTPKMFRT